MFIPQVAIVPKLNTGTADKAVSSVIDVIELACHNAKVKIVPTSEIDHHTIVIAVGGDGTMLEAMRLAHKANGSALGINLGQVGFLTDFDTSSHDGIYVDLMELFSQVTNFDKHNIKFMIGQRMVLTINEEHFAFNEFVISSKFSNEVMKYELFIGETFAGVHRSNGLIVSTPTGSTAYSLSVGGPLMFPTMSAMQISAIAPIGMTSRPIIVPGGLRVKVHVVGDTERVILADGRKIDIDCDIIITKAQSWLKMIQPAEWSYFKMLTDKLGWKTHG